MNKLNERLTLIDRTVPKLHSWAEKKHDRREK